MPVINCQKDNKPGYKWGAEGTCYNYNPNDRTSKEAARRKARKQGAAIEISKGTFQTYDDYPKTASNNACKVLRWIDEHGRDEVKGMTQTGLARANQLCSGKNISRETIGRMAAFERHRKNSEIDKKYKGTPWKDKGYVAWLGWGGDAGIRWAQRKLDQIDRKEFSCDCGEHFNIKDIVFNDNIDEQEKEKLVIGEIHKEAIVNYLESEENVGVTIEELGIKEEDLYNPKYYVIVDAEEESLNFNEIVEEQFRIINLYKYVSNIYGPSNVGPNTRPFCRSLVNRTNLSLLRFQDINALNSLNPGFGKGGSNTYSVFNWRGGVNCKHVWLKYFYDTDSMNLVEAPRNQQPRQSAVNGRVPYANGTNRPTKK